MWDSHTNTEVEDEGPKDIVEELREIDAKTNEMLESAMVVGNIMNGPSVFKRAADEIENLRNILGLMRGGDED